MKKIELTQGKHALVDDEDYEELMKFKWYYGKHKKENTGYAWRNVKIPGSKKKRLLSMHRAILNVRKGKLTDHRDGDGLNNQKSNLRICSNTQNSMNSRKCISSRSSRYKGVSWHKVSEKWVARIMAKGKGIHLGYFDIEKEAAKVYDEAAIKNFGEFAQLNFPSKK